MSARTDAAVPAAAPARSAAVGRSPLVDRIGASLRRTVATALLEVRLNVLSPGPWIVGLVLSVLAYIRVRTATDNTSFPLAWSLSQDLAPLGLLLLVFLSASMAHRPLRYEMAEILNSKRVASEELLFGRWLGMLVAVLVPLLIEYAVTGAAQKIHSRHPLVPLAYLDSAARVLPAALFFTTLAFCLVVLTRILVLGAGIAALLWFGLYSGQADYPTAFRIDLAQNRYVFLGMTAAVLLLVLARHQMRRRAKRSRMGAALHAGAGVLFAATALHAAWVTLALPNARSAAATTRRLEAGEHHKSDPLPNFAWTDTHSRRVSLVSLRGKPALLVFIRPTDGGLVGLLQRLADLDRDFRADRLGVLGILVSEDLEAAGQAAALAGRAPELVTDWGSLPEGATPEHPASAVARALHVNGTPAAILVDARGREITRDLPLDETSWTALKARLTEAIGAVPAVPRRLPTPARREASHDQPPALQPEDRAADTHLDRHPGRAAGGAGPVRRLPADDALQDRGCGVPGRAVDPGYRRLLQCGDPGRRDEARRARAPVLQETSSLADGPAPARRGDADHDGDRGGYAAGDPLRGPPDPVGMLLLAATPSALVVALISLWARIRLGNQFIGYVVTAAVWIANVTALLLEHTPLPITLNPLLELASYSRRLHAIEAGVLDTSPYVDWWWVSKVALLIVSFGIFVSVTRRVEQLVEGD